MSNCPFCHMLLAPSDPSLVTCHEITAHRHCVVKNRQVLEALCREAAVFFGSLALLHVYQQWAARMYLGQVNSRDSLIATLRSCLQAVDSWRLRYGTDDSFTYPSAVYIDDFRMSMGRKLVCEL